MYTTKRMQRVFTVKFSGDATYVYTGSDDMNVRVWKVGGRRARMCACASVCRGGGGSGGRKVGVRVAMGTQRVCVCVSV